MGQDPGDGEDDGDAEHSEREREVLADGFERGAGEGEEVRDAGELVGEQADVGGLDREVGAARAHRDPDVGDRECGSIVDAVADERDLPSLFLEVLDDLRFAGREHLRVDLTDAELVGDPLCGRLVIAGDQHGSGAELVNRRTWPARLELQSAVFDYIEAFTTANAGTPP